MKTGSRARLGQATLRLAPWQRAGVLVGAGALLAACASATVPDSRDTSTDLSFNGCDTVACQGTIEGADYEILLPDTWNGTLLLYSHGYRGAEPFPPTFDPIVTTPVPVPGWDEGSLELGESLLERGYALAGSAYASNGWAVEDGVAAAEQIYDFFSSNIATPKRVIVWGDSLGGLITTELAEKGLDWINGAVPLCGVMAGLVPNIGLAFDAAYSTQQLIYPEMKIVEFSSYEEAVANWEGAASRLIQAGRDQDLETIAKMFTIAAMVDAPDKTFSQDGADITSQVTGTIESLLTALAYGTVGRFDIEQRYGGNVSGNEGTDYALRLDDAERTLIDTIGGDGAANRFVTQLDNGPRTAANPTAQAAALERGGNPNGAITVPMITMHTANDPLVIVENQTFFADRYRSAVANQTAQGDLIQLYTVPPATYSPETGAPYGAGHCNFTPQSRIAVIELMEQWIQDGLYPGQNAIVAAMGSDSGYSPLFTPGPWPDLAAVVTE
ncbi:MAG: hypothetical protein WAO41_01265 [Candidatus Nanopelagicales bacterium]